MENTGMRKNDHLSVMYLIEVARVLTNQLLDANKQIEELKARIKELEEERRWIPVEERLPKEGHTVLVLTFNSGATTAWRSENEWLGCYSNITHWMPLPPPPKEVK